MKKRKSIGIYDKKIKEDKLSNNLLVSFEKSLRSIKKEQYKEYERVEYNRKNKTHHRYFDDFHSDSDKKSVIKQSFNYLMAYSSLCAEVNKKLPLEDRIPTVPSAFIENLHYKFVIDSDYDDSVIEESLNILALYLSQRDNCIYTVDASTIVLFLNESFLEAEAEELRIHKLTLAESGLDENLDDEFDYSYDDFVTRIVYSRAKYSKEEYEESILSSRVSDKHFIALGLISKEDRSKDIKEKIISLLHKDFSEELPIVENEEGGYTYFGIKDNNTIDLKLFIGEILYTQSFSDLSNRVFSEKPPRNRKEREMLKSIKQEKNSLKSEYKNNILWYSEDSSLREFYNICEKTTYNTQRKIASLSRLFRENDPLFLVKKFNSEGLKELISNGEVEVVKYVISNSGINVNDNKSDLLKHTLSECINAKDMNMMMMFIKEFDADWSSVSKEINTYCELAENYDLLDFIEELEEQEEQDKGIYLNN